MGLDIIKELQKPQMVAVVPKDHHCLIEIRAEDLKKIHKAMQMSTHNKSLIEGSEEKVAWEYFANTFYDFINESVEHLNKNGITSDSE